MEKIDIVLIWENGDRRPGYVLGASWDQAQHDFTDYLATERRQYQLPDDYEIAADQCGARHIYPVAGDQPMRLYRHASNRPAITNGDKTVVLYPAE